MPRRHAASGDMPTPQDTINVAMPRPSRPPIRLKLNIRPRQPEPEPELPPARPKRKISRPARYSNNVFEPLTKKRRLTADLNMSPQAPTSPHAASNLPPINSSDPVVLTSREPADKSDYVDSYEVEPAGYGDDFLSNFIDDTPRSSLSALYSVIGSVKSYRPDSDFLPESDALPAAAGLMYDTSADLASEPPAYFGNEMQSPVVLSSSLSSLPQQPDSPEVSIRKLQNACQALGRLSMPPVQQQIRPPSSRDDLRGTSTHESVHDIGVDLADQQYNVDSSVDALLAAATGSDRYEDAGDRWCDGVHFGEPDVEILLLINKAIEILHHHIANIRRLKAQAALQHGRPSQGKGSEDGPWKTDTEQLVMTALQSLLRGGATDIGCIISSERANLLWRLYSQLTHFVTTPHIVLSRTFRLLQQVESGVIKKQRRSCKRSNVPQKGKTANVPVPHKFLSRQAVSKSMCTPIAPPPRQRDQYTGAARRFRIRSPYGHQAHRNELAPPQPHPMFFNQPPYGQVLYGQPPPLTLPVRHGMFLPNAPHFNGKARPGPAAFASQGFGRHPMPTMPMFAQPQYSNYQHMMPPSFPPDSWVPMPNFGLPPGLRPVQHVRHNIFWR
ncbi:hypothetical protein E4T38_06915 [Aureobasidium subglaciale]|nr:hypothetical protein E4T38_06915 [Aureobasidium subglaciale]KAI5218501.1 hypothetical protein E4T40_06846 [Aureobasidium subglaciale]KAI5222177.1 hypothetical protein E4T41_06766 [Aureobasidium subglaciale]KAI5259703.1 hypothetical protein E4T46_06744 [Aureobasidium subglaciale]